jgi:hypothetical protein
VRLAIKLPDAPRALGISDPYPDLLDDWNQTTHQWSWQVVSPDAAPEVERAIEIVQQYQPESGPMTAGPAQEANGQAALAPPA